MNTLVVLVVLAILGGSFGYIFGWYFTRKKNNVAGSPGSGDSKEPPSTY